MVRRSRSGRWRPPAPAIAGLAGAFGLCNGLIAAAKVDTLCLTSCEVGMFAWMAAVQFSLLPGLERDRWTFWFMMRIAMLLGLGITVPMNWWM
ncbi:MAG: DUF4396 domain-containing protein [Acetobacteraceae bacterium]|nr:DUF4396 domain-containing protein [Acetobacteraceae bacterium]